MFVYKDEYRRASSLSSASSILCSHTHPLLGLYYDCNDRQNDPQIEWAKSAMAGEVIESYS